MNRYPIGQRWSWRSVVLAAGSVLAVMCCSAAFASDIATNAKVLAKLDEDWSKAAAAKDVDRVASFYAEDAIAYPPNAPAAVGKAEAKKVWAGFITDPNASISWKPTHAQVSGDLGFTTGTYEYSSKGSDGKTANDTGKYVCVWKKQKDGSWKAIHDMWNSDSK